MQDIRLQSDALSHPKVAKLRRRLGADAVVSLITLWCWVARNRPKGNLDNMDVDDIEIAADWRLNPGVLIPCLVELRLLDQLKSGYRVHDWEELQPWAYSSPERVEKARERAKKSWDKRNELEATENKPEKSMHKASITNAQCNAPSPVPSPSPSPSPTPTSTATKKRRKRINTEYTPGYLAWWKNVWLPHEAHRNGAGQVPRLKGSRHGSKRAAGRSP